MKRILIFLGFMSLALAACGGSSQNAAVSVEPVSETVVSTESPLSEITDASAALAEGNRLFDENQTEAAIAALKHAITLNPDLAEAHFRLGIAYDLLELQMKREGVVTEPTNTNSKEVRKKTNAEKAFEKAVVAYKKWIAANPKDDIAHFNLGRTYSKLAKDEDAEEAFDEAVKLKPGDTEYQTELGAILVKLALYREAIVPLKKAIELDSANGRAINLLEDAEAGRQRVDYISPKNTNQANANKIANPNANIRANSNSNSSSVPPETNTKIKKDDPKESRPRVIANKPN